ncbi:Fe-S protein assembly chaperone HscA [Rickettsia endosymbiont of Polydrusus tereticollis]|uniref:Fe-S protein assembly chaperone HscA n=1 Tax=Rickettsia endosymbiont of Polydrusus tereticollis TaxID=3066251 RepID=UPI0031331657
MQIIEIQEPGLPIHENGQQIAVGIDFGTTNSLIAVSNGGITKIIKTANNQELIPSTIEFKDENFIIGSNKGIRSIKRLFGKSFAEILNNAVLFSLIKDYIEVNSKELKLDFAGELISITELAAKIFIYLKQQAEKELMTEITKVVITVPAHFNDAARGEIMWAAKIAGLEVLRLIAEPTAAAYAYGLNKKQSGCYLIYDLGGGTFDVSILNMQEGIFQVIATGGDNMLGGDDIDNLIAEYFCNKFNVPYSVQILKAAKEAKEILSYQNDFKEGYLSLNKQTFEQLIFPLINKTITIVKDTLLEAENPNIDGIILVGGTTRIPLITNRLKESFATRIFSDIDPDKAVVFGAALQAENLTSPNINSLLIDVVPLSLGMELYGGLVEKIILRNSPLPISVTKEFTSYADNQTGIQFHILQGERETVADCRSLARFELTNLPLMKAGGIRVEVTFAIDADGILSVSALEKTSGKSHAIEVKPTHGLNEEEITKSLENAYKNAANDYTTRLLQETIINTESLIFSVENAMKELPNLRSENERQEIYRAIKGLKEAITLRNRELIIKLTKNFEFIAKDFIAQRLSFR